MHLKRKIYFSILTIVHFKINMEMDSMLRTPWIAQSMNVYRGQRGMFDDCLAFMRSIQRQSNHLLFVWCDSCECLYLSSWLLFAVFASNFYSWHRSLRQHWMHRKFKHLFNSNSCRVIFPFHHTQQRPSALYVSQFVCGGCTSNMNEIIDALDLSVAAGIVLFCLLFH